MGKESKDICVRSYVSERKCADLDEYEEKADSQDEFVFAESERSFVLIRKGFGVGLAEKYIESIELFHVKIFRYNLFIG